MTQTTRQDNTLRSLTLSELRETLKERGVDMGLSTLSELIKDGDIAEQLGAQRKGNKLLFPPDATDVLAAFISHFRENPNFKNAARPDALRSFLQKDTPGALVPTAASSLTLSEIRETANLGAQIVAAMHQCGLIPAPEDRLLTLKEAATLYGVSSRALHHISLKEGGRRKVKQSRLRAYLRDL